MNRDELLRTCTWDQYDFANITVENNDVHQNHRGIQNNTRGSTNIVIRQNDGAH